MRFGGGRACFLIAAESVRATSRIAALPDALSLAPADSWQMCAVITTSPADGSVPGIVATTTS